MKHGPPDKPMEEAPKVLTFEEFTYHDKAGLNHPRFNNFFLYFEKGWAADIYKSTEHYKRFEREHPDLALDLNKKIQNTNKMGGTSEALKPYLKDLYEAYVIMRGYGVSDTELFR